MLNQILRTFFSYSIKQIYKMFLKKEGKWLKVEELFEILSEIDRDSNSRPINPIEDCVALLTSDSRTNWANARNILLKSNFTFNFCFSFLDECDFSFSDECNFSFLDECNFSFLDECVFSFTDELYFLFSDE
jgi:hypothetical protein